MDKIDRIIQIIHNLKEEGAIANSVGAGGLTSSSSPPDRLAGYDKQLLFTRRRVIGLGKNSRNRWKNTSNM